MNIDITLKLKPDDETAALLVRILGKLVALESSMSATEEKIAQLVQAVTDQGTIIESAITLISGLSAALEAAKDDPEQLQAVIDQLNGQKEALATAVSANTPTA